MRHTTTIGRWSIAAAVVLVAAGSAGVAAANSSTNHPVTQEAIERALTEVPVCWGSTPAPVSTIAMGADMVETVALTIEATALIKVDADGRVLAAETNTGCAPRSGDRIYLVHPDGSMDEAPQFDVATIRWSGDFTRFGYRSQT